MSLEKALQDRQGKKKNIPAGTNTRKTHLMEKYLEPLTFIKLYVRLNEAFSRNWNLLIWKKCQRLNALEIFGIKTYVVNLKKSFIF